MKTAVAILTLVLVGCSSMPMADLMDRVKPGELPPGPYRGGVCGCPQPAGPAAVTFAPPPEGEIVAAAPAPVGAITATPVPVADPTAKAAPSGWRRP